MYQDRTWFYIPIEEFKKYKNSFQCKNLEKINKRKLGFYGWQNMPDIVNHFEQVWQYIKVPLGLISFWDDKIEKNFSPNKITHPEFIDFSNPDPELTPKQNQAVEELWRKRVSFLHASTWTWKSRMIAKIIESKQVKTLVVCAWLELMTQMKKDLEWFYKITPLTISWKKTKQKNAYQDIVVWNIDSLQKLPKEFFEQFDLILMDEVDRFLQSESRRNWIFSLSPYYLYGLTWTIKLNHIEDKVFNIYLWDKKELLIKHFSPNIYKVITWFEYSEGQLEDVSDLHWLKKELFWSVWRNTTIIELIKDTLNWRKGVLFTEYVEHAKFLELNLTAHWIKTFCVIGENTSEERAIIKKELKEYNWPCMLVWSVKIIWRGYDVPELSVWYFMTVEKFKSNIEQYVWRIIRKFEWKTSCDWYDLCDINVKFLSNQSRQRDSAYKKEFPKSPIKIIYPKNNYFDYDEWL